ncbi:MAG: AbrB/MazE/SpoVT family DNA-binding domain-containing protein, partial [Nanoarchaeota archaeon]
MISLPRKWSQKYNIQKGDELDIKEEGNKLFVSAEEKTDEPSEIEVKVDTLDKDSLIFLLRALYIRGYDQIRFSFANPYIFHHRLGKKVTISSIIHTEVAICQGLDIIQERRDFIVMKNISASSTKEFDTLLRRIFLLLIDTTNDLYMGAKNRDYALLETFQDKHDTVTRLINYNLKILNTMGHPNYRDTILSSNILSLLDVVIDILKNAARDIIETEMKLGAKALKIVDKVHDAIRLYYELFYNFSLDKAEKFIKY